MDFVFKLSNITNEQSNLKKIRYNSMLNEQRRIMYMLQQQNALRQQNMAVVVPVPVPAPAPVPTISTNNKLLKKGFNVVLSKLNH